ncbi:SDR family NAD(P)-dependent oxidoreductase [Williamsia deligens]|uniref:SDR family NAD(P)-dependent oxidoreductase n=1 Tax=Williamsia deligens TaxID=321325 RepID=A0ABW3G7J8_9NOCA|nr:SDR family NAD(P)-dependent oxidoreductase [Williamsia deligens]MCP2194406.1 Short-chain dehydrogenase [Williamsia deligens]
MAPPPSSPRPPRDLDGTTVIVTGANSGIGLRTAEALASRGAHTVLAVRDVSRGEDAASHLSGSTEVLPLDLTAPESLREFVRRWGSRPVDWLVNNAGISTTDLRRTATGRELQFATNHLGPFALTNLLLPVITRRIVTVSSMAERQARLDLDDIDWERRPYKGFRAYADSKQANLLFTAELQRRLDAAGSAVTALAAHPGFVATNIYDETTNPLARLALRFVAQGPAQGALPVLHATLGDLPGDTFTGPEHLFHMRGGSQVITRSSRAADPEFAAALWDVSERITGVTFPL